MPPKNLVPAKQPNSAAKAFKQIAEILNAGIWTFPQNDKYNGTGAPGRYLEDLLGIKENNADSPDLADWEVKFHGGTSLLTLFHKDPEPRGIVRTMIHNHGWKDEHDRISFRHTISGETARGFYVTDEDDRIVVRNKLKDAPVPHWTHNTLLNALSAKLRRLILVQGEMLTNPRRVVYQKAIAYWEPDLKGFAKAVADGVVLIDFDARTQGGAGSAIRNHGTKFRIKIEDLPKIYAHKKIITTGKG